MDGFALSMRKGRNLACAAVDGKIYTLCFNKQLKVVDTHIFDPQRALGLQKRPPQIENWKGKSCLLLWQWLATKFTARGHGLYGECILNNKVYSTIA